MIKNGMEPLVTISHYEMPLNLCTSYNGWLSRELIDFYTRYCKTIFERYSGKVRYWILMNQVNCIDAESFNTLGILSDRVENLEEAKYQALHNQLVASGRAIGIGRHINPDFKFGCMLSYRNAFSASDRSEIALEVLKYNQIQFYGLDVAVRGEIPSFMYRYYEEHGMEIDISDQDLIDISNTVDFTSFSTIATACFEKMGVWERVARSKRQRVPGAGAMMPLGSDTP